MPEPETRETVDAASARSWTRVPELKGARLLELFADLKTLEAAQEKLAERMSAIRGLISESICRLTFPVRVQDRVVRWVPERDSTHEKPDVKRVLALAIQMGATPDEVKQCMVPDTKKAHLRVDKCRAVEEDGCPVDPVDAADVQEILEELAPRIFPPEKPSAQPSELPS